MKKGKTPSKSTPKDSTNASSSRKKSQKDNNDDESQSESSFDSDDDSEVLYNDFGERINIPSYESDFATDDLSSGDEEKIPRLKFKFSVPNQTVTHPSHLSNPKFGGSLEKYLDSFISLDDDITLEERDSFVDDQVEVRNRIERAKKSGLLQRHTHGLATNIEKFADPPSFDISNNHHSHLVSHAIYFARLMTEERKAHISRARRIANIVDLHFKRLSGAEEKERKQFERSMRQLARRTGAEVMKKWKVAEKVVRQRRQQALEEQQRNEGKLQLNQILKQSAQLLEARTEKMTASVNVDDLSDATDENESAGSLADSDDESDAGGSESSDNDSEVMSSSDDDSEVEDVDDEKLTVEQLKEKYSKLKSVTFNDLENKVDVDIIESEDEDEEETVEIDEKAKSLYEEEQSGDSDESVAMDSEFDSDEDDSDESEEASDEEDEPASLASLFNKPQSNDDKQVEADDEQDEYKEPEIEVDIEANQEDQDSDASDKSIKHSSPDTPTSTPEHEHGEIADGTVTTTSHIPTPFLLRGKLREYQSDGLDWLAGLYNTDTNGILADEMGLGKTIQTISLISYLACEKHIWGPHLIVVPTSVMLNWEMEFKRFAPGFKVMTYYGNPNQRKEKRKGWNKENTWHVCITSYQLVLQDRNVFKRKKWHYMILDEAHNIKNFRSQRWQALLNFNSERRLLLTGTPLQNNLMELWSLLYFLMPSSKGSAMLPDGFANLKDFQEWFARPVDKLVEGGGQDADDETRATVLKLHQILRPYLLRRLKADVEKQMPAKYEHIVYCRLSKRQRYLYDDFMSRAQTRETLSSGNFLSIINCLMQLRKVCNHPDLFEVRPIVTSLAIGKSVVSNFEPLDIIVRKRLLRESYEDHVNLLTLNLLPIKNEGSSFVDWQTIQQLQAYTPMVNELNELVTQLKTSPVQPNYVSIEGNTKYQEYRAKQSRCDKLQHSIYLNFFRCSRKPIYGNDLVSAVTLQNHRPRRSGFDWRQSDALSEMKLSYEQRDEQMKEIITRYAFVTPKVVCLNMTRLTLAPVVEEMQSPENQLLLSRQQTFHEAQVKLSIAFPDKRLLQYDCGKLQRLSTLMRDLIDGGHRALIFTQMTKVLDILEQFLNIHGWRYLRLDGATKVEQRQVLTERFNTDARIPVFILSTRSGGLGINLTGADTVIFYDSDWNPSMDKQCQDRCHRIGQTRDVHIYRFVSEYTIESNILRKATQKQILDNVVIQEGDFTTDYFHKMSVKELVGDVAGVDLDHDLAEPPQNSRSLAKALAQAEDADDAVAASVAMREANLDAEDFSERATSTAATPGRSESEQPTGVSEQSVEPPTGASVEPTDGSVEPSVEPDALQSEQEPDLSDSEESDDGIGHIDDYMIKFIEAGYFGD
ncbi:chromatin-remodeling protein SWR1 [Sugiyamaella lignohabitans]|uniref:Helicase SWR1 n=1 Tax=Sugiyamaella lignohabitans TaxID=796027 RepID=A0A167ERA9_9ASCO|nr:chromatin-remodeling protein SWR1 [Sugiyamaella lignohabitans]ANB14381.1 chromatin-remodeling protein SWR1 [Sugiyamaella lignohabitans]